MRQRLVSSLGPVALALASAALCADELGCGEAPAPLENVVRKGALIQGGTVDQADTNVVGIIICADGQLTALCSGSLIGPNLVLTAQHCVNTPPATLTCGATFTETEGQSYLVTTSYDAAEQLWTSSNPACPMRDQTVWWGVSTVNVAGNDICGDDLAALTLTSPITGVCPLIPLVDQPPSSGEAYRAVGFGITAPGSDVAGERYQVSGMAVQCVGSSQCQNIGSGTTEWVGGSSSPQGTCEGDSGGPALDSSNRVMGSVSRGPAGACNQTVYESYYGQAAWIKAMATQAAQAGGYTPAGWVTGGATSNAANGYCTSSSATPPPPEGSQAFLYPNQQHFLSTDAAGNIRHHWWDAVFVYSNGDQEAFVRGTGGTVEHFWWDAQLGISHDTWGTGIAQDPTAEVINAQQHVWALDAAGHAQHWYWGPVHARHQPRRLGSMRRMLGLGHRLRITRASAEASSASSVTSFGSSRGMI